MIPLEQLRDQSYVRLKSGGLFALHGDQVLHGALVGDLAFVTDHDGPYRSRSGARYSKGYAQDQHVRDQKLKRAFVRTENDTRLELPYSTVEAEEVVEVVSVDTMREEALASRFASAILRVEQFILNLAGSGDRYEARDVSFGMTGSVGLGLKHCGAEKPHDIDLVVTAHPEALNRLVRQLHARWTNSAQVRVHEYGKDWRIRQWVGVDLLCPFFRRTEFDAVRVQRWDDTLVDFVGEVIDDSGAAVVPTWVDVESQDHGLVRFYILGLRSRGDLRKGDRVQVRGRWATVRSRGELRPAVVSTADAPELVVGAAGFYDDH